MKRLVKIVVSTLLVLALLPVSTLAATEAPKTEDIIYLDNGCYITVELTVTEARAARSKSGSKTYICHANDGSEEWRAVLNGTFSYTGTSSLCTVANCTVTITNTNWYEVSKTATRSGNAAVAELTMGRKFLGITIDKESYTMRITCDANGNLS